MAKQSNQSNAPEEHKTFVQEVDSALREEKLRAVWQTYKTVIIGGVLLLFAGVAGKEWYGQYAYQQNQKDVNAYVDAAKVDTVEAYKSIVESESAYAPVAAIEAAKIALNEGRVTEAVALYNTIIESKGAPQFMKDLSHYYAALALMDNDITTAEKHAAVLTGGKSVFQLSGMELQAQIYIQKGEKATAANFLERIMLDAAAPASLKQRAQQTLANLAALS